MDVIEELTRAFEDLLTVINHGSELCESMESLAEAGLLVYQHSHSEKQDSVIFDESVGSDQSFEDAQEFSALPSSGIMCPAFLLTKRATI